MSAADATELVGETVTMREPTALTPDVVIHDAETGEPILGYMRLADPGPIRRALMTVDCSSGVQRQRNYRSRSRTFGFSPRRPTVRRESCSLTALSIAQPEVASLLESYASELGAMLGEIDPDIIARDSETLAEVLPDWRMGTAKLWTSGVINDTASLPYHRDGFNFPTWSAMPVLRRGTRGGHLHLPEYDLTLPCHDGSVIFFQGQRYVHGVTPIVKVAPDGYRFSVVYYALRGMKNCREAAEEAAFARTRRTERESDMARRIAAGDLTIPTKPKMETT